MSIKIRIVLYIIVLLAGIGLYLYYTPDKPKWNPWYCGQFSGVDSFAWGKSSPRCIQAGCKVQNGRLIDDPNVFDDERVEYKCVR